MNKLASHGDCFFVVWAHSTLVIFQNLVGQLNDLHYDGKWMSELWDNLGWRFICHGMFVWNVSECWLCTNRVSCLPVPMYLLASLPASHSATSLLALGRVRSNYSVLYCHCPFRFLLNACQSVWSYPRQKKSFRKHRKYLKILTLTCKKSCQLYGQGRYNKCFMYFISFIWGRDMA